MADTTIPSPFSPRFLWWGTVRPAASVYLYFGKPNQELGFAEERYVVTDKDGVPFLGGNESVPSPALPPGPWVVPSPSDGPLVLDAHASYDVYHAHRRLTQAELDELNKAGHADALRLGVEHLDLGFRHLLSKVIMLKRCKDLAHDLFRVEHTDRKHPEESFSVQLHNLGRWAGPSKTAPHGASAREVVFFFLAKLSVDADGAPNAYHPDVTGPTSLKAHIAAMHPPEDKKHPRGALDYLGNAHDGDDWFGVVTGKDKKPVTQSSGPFTGFYISKSSYQDGENADTTDPARQCDSTQVPFYVLPGHPRYKIPDPKHPGQFLTDGKGKFLRDDPTLRHPAELGDIAVIYNAATGKLAFAIYADAGPTESIGEGSIALCEDLGTYGPDTRRDAIPGHGGNDHRVKGEFQIAYVVFPGTKQAWPWRKTVDEMRAEGQKLFEKWGGYGRLQCCFPEIEVRAPVAMGDFELPPPGGPRMV
jgi:hypothetical protein